MAAGTAHVEEPLREDQVHMDLDGGVVEAGDDEFTVALKGAIGDKLPKEVLNIINAYKAELLSANIALEAANARVERLEKALGELDAGRSAGGNQRVRQRRQK